MSASQDSAQSSTAPDRGTSMTLMGRLRGNEAAAWERLFHLYGPLVKYWCGRWGLGPDDADDVTQEVFRAVSGGFQQFRHDQPGDTFRGWLRGVTRNQLLMHLRRAKRQPTGSGGTDAFLRMQDLAEASLSAPIEDDPATEVSALYRRALELVRSEFEEKTWTAFWRNVVDGQTPDMIAAETGVSAAAVRKAKSRVLRRLKEEVGELID